jgi:Na+-driven multidrug efflux pump
MIVNSMTNDFGVSVSAFAGISANINTTANLILGAIATAGAMVLGQNLAAGKLKRVKKTLFIVGAITISLSLLLALMFLIFPIPLFRIFTSEPAVLAIVHSYLPILTLNFLSSGIRPVTRALIDGSGNKKINLVNALLDAVVARIAFAYIFGIWRGWGYLGFWFGSALAAYVPIIIGIVFYFTGIWKKSVKIKDALEA